MNKEKAKPKQMDAEEAKKKEARKSEKKREKFKQELLKGVKHNPGKEEVDREQVISAVAEEMLKVFSSWPEEIQALVGTTQPDKDTFARGINHVVGSYLQRAMLALRKQTLAGVRAKEVEAAKMMGPLSDALGRLQRTKQKVDVEDVEKLKIEKERRIREATAVISQEYNEKIKAVQSRSSEELESVGSQMIQLERGYLKRKAELEDGEQKLLKTIKDLGAPYDSKESAIAPDPKASLLPAVAAVLATP